MGPAARQNERRDGHGLDSAMATTGGGRKGDVQYDAGDTCGDSLHQ